MPGAGRGEGVAVRELNRIADQIKRAHEGGAWHGPSVREALSGVSAARAVARPISGAHSIWELALHIAAWRQIATLRLAGQPVLTLPEGDWPAAGGADEVAWNDARALVELRYRELLAAVRGFDEDRLDLPLAEGFSSAYVTLHGVIQHDLYHAGQISLLKKS
jgi:uncharacterized damage-inducible protein DinB